MPFKVFRKSDLIAGAIVFGLSMLFLTIAVLGDQLPFTRIRISGASLSPEHPDFARHLSTLRIGAGFAGAACCVLSCFAFRHSRKVADT
jgi:hypothetical protein